MIGKFQLHTKDIEIYVGRRVMLSFSIDNNQADVTIAENYKETIFVLQKYGHIFTQLNIEISPDGEFIEGIRLSINKYCVNAVTALKIYVDGQKLTDTDVSIANVTSVNLCLIYGASVKKPLRLDKVFPQMQKLELDYNEDLAYHYPHLTEFVFHDNSKQHYHWNWFDFVRLNPQIRKIKSPNFNNNTFIPSLSRLLPNLESLSVRVLRSTHYHNMADEVACFNNVTDFTIDLPVEEHGWNDDNVREIFESIQFNHLESFTVNTRVRSSFPFMFKFALESTALKRLSIKNYEVFPWRLAKLVETLPDLKELSISWYDVSTFEALVRFLADTITNEHALEKLNLFNNNFLNDDIEAIIPNGWNYKEIELSNTKWVQLYRFN